MESNGCFMIFQSTMWIGFRGILGSQLEIANDWILMKQLERMRTLLHWKTARNWSIRSWCFFNVNLWCNWNTSGFVWWYSKAATCARKATINHGKFHGICRFQCWDNPVGNGSGQSSLALLEWGPHWHNQSQSQRWRGTATRPATGEFSMCPKSFRSGCDLWFLQDLYGFVTYECLSIMMPFDFVVCKCLHNHMVSVLSLDDTRFIPWCRVLWCWYIIIMSKDQRTGRSPEDSADSKKDRPQPRPQCCRCATFSSATEGLPMHWPRGKCRVCQPEHVVQRGQGMCVNLPMNIRRMSWWSMVILYASTCGFP